MSFAERGQPDVYALDRRGRFLAHTLRYRVRVHELVRRRGLSIPDSGFDLYTPRDFVPSIEPSGEAPRMLVVVGDHSLRPGFNLKTATPLDAPRGALRGATLGSPAGTVTIDLFRSLQVRARQLPARETSDGGHT